LNRIPEPELMLDEAQALAYAKADFAPAHDRYPALFAALFPRRPRHARVLDIGCGPCDVTIRFAETNPAWRFDAVDGSRAMLAHAPRHPRIRLIQGCLPDVRLPAKPYDVILSSSVLHHLHDPQVLWQTVHRHASPGTLVFVVDLRRPAIRIRAKALVGTYATGEPAILRRDFYNSLLAAFTPAEVRRQVAGTGLRVRAIGNRHLVVFGSVR
jgi:2-polyprenyl-3-methyl-5-hydroxy-6-metoxy-1,4-benzoquinol methylase